MNKINLWKWMFVALMGLFTLTMVGCSEDDSDSIQAPKLEVSNDALNFSEEGGHETVQITANCSWKVSASDWITVTPISGSGDCTIEISVGETTSARNGEITFTLIHDTYGAWGKADDTIRVVQTYGGAEAITEAIYTNDFDKEAAAATYGSGTSWPYLDQFEGWKNEQGSGVAEVTYSYNGMSARNNSNSNGSYSDYAGSGVNNMFFGKQAYLKVENIALSTSNLQLVFGAEMYDNNNKTAEFATENFTVTLSADGKTWTTPVAYTHNIAAARWGEAKFDFSVPAGTEKLYIKFAAATASVYRLDDLRLLPGQGGEEVAFTESEDSGSGDSGDTPTPGDTVVGPFTSDAAFVSYDDSFSNPCGLGEVSYEGTTVSGFKLGTGSKTGLFESSAIGVEGEKYLSFYAMAWKGKSATLYVKVDGTLIGSYELQPNDGASGNPPFVNLTFSAENFFSVKLSGLTTGSKISFSTSENFAVEANDNSGRAILAGVKLTDEELTATEGSAGEGGAGGEDTGDLLDYTKVTSFEAGEYAIVAEGLAATPIAADKNYGYLYDPYAVTDNGGKISAPATCAFVFKAVDGGYTIQQPDGRYLIMTGEYNSFNLSDSASEGAIWSVTAQGDGTFKILNTSVNKYIQYSVNYTSYGVYADAQGTLPFLYRKGEASQGGEDTPETPEDPSEVTCVTIAEFISKADTQGVYQLTGTIENIKRDDDGIFTLTDATGSISIYGLLSPEGEAGVQFRAAGLQQGDELTVQGRYSTYYTEPQMENATYVSHISGQVLTIAEFLTKADALGNYRLTGTIENIERDDYGIFTLTDATGSIYIYGLLSPEGESKVQFRAAGLKAGDTLTLVGSYSTYYGVPQIEDAIYVSHTAGAGGGEDTPDTPVEDDFLSQSHFTVTAADSNNSVYPLSASTANGSKASGFKMGTSSKSGIYTSPALGVSGDNTLTFYAVAWDGKSATLYVRADGGTAHSFVLNDNEGAAGNEPYTLVNVTSSDKYSVAFTGLTENSIIEFSTSPNFAREENSAARAVVFGVKLSNAPADVEPETPDTPDESEVVAINTITQAGDYVAEGTVVAAVKGAYVIADQTGAIYVYGYNHNRTVGEKIRISGAVTIYNQWSTPQFSTSTATVEVLSTGNTWSYSPTVLDGAAMDTQAATIECKEVQISGTLSFSGDNNKYANVAVEGAEYIGSIKYYDNTTLQAGDVVIKGYYIGTSKSGDDNYFNIIPYSIE